MYNVGWYWLQDTIGGRLAYKGRFNLDVCQVHDLAEGQGEVELEYQSLWFL